MSSFKVMLLSGGYITSNGMRVAPLMTLGLPTQHTPSQAKNDAHVSSSRKLCVHAQPQGCVQKSGCSK